MSENTTWTAENSPYVVNGVLTIPSGISLTVEPGVVVKFAHTQAKIAVQGALQVNGAENSGVVYFTSYKDDTVGGDTNGDELATIPGPNDWPQIIIYPGATADFVYATVRYGGYKPFFCPESTCWGAINNRGALNFSNSRIFQTDKYGIYQTAGATVADSSFFSDQNQAGIYIVGGDLAVSDSIVTNQGHTGIVVSSGGTNFDLNHNTFASNVRDVWVYASVNFTHSDNVSAGGLGAGFHIQGVTAGIAVWQPDNIPYIVEGFLQVPVAGTLSIEPGVVVKFAHNQSQIDVYGALEVSGTEENKVYFTSLKDDEIGGDTNGNGGATMPAANDWRRILVHPGGAAEIDHAVIRYGGFRQFSCPDSTCYGGVNNRGELNITDTRINKNGNYGIYQTAGDLAVHQSEIFDHGLFGLANYSVNTADATGNWWGDDTGPYHPTLNPAGLGNRVSDKVLFDPWTTQAAQIDPVIIIPGILGSAEKDGVWLIDPIFHTYDNLIDTLAVNGYTVGVDLFTFPYNWRQSNTLTAFQLHQKIDEVKSICACGQVDLVAHSMGGLVARQYAQSDYYENDIDQLIFLGTPHFGSPSAYLAWEGGATQPGFDNTIVKLFLSFEAKKLGFSSLFDYVRNNPIASVQELLPIYDYLRDNDTGLMRKYPNNYSINIFLENLNNTSSSLFSSGIKITNIVGEAGVSSTINALRVVPSTGLPLWEHGYPDGFNEKIGDRGLEYGAGDGTVPKNSAESISVDVNRIISGHLEIPSNGEDKIYKKLTDKIASILIKKSLIRRLLMIKLFSPVDMIIVDPDGKRIGKDFVANQEINEIENAFYSGFNTDDEYVTIPNPLEGAYRVETVGTDNGGEYTVAIGLITDDGISEHDFTATTLPGMLTALDIAINNTENTIEVTPEDTLPPVITILSPEARDYTRAETLLINTTSTDAGTGVLLHQVSWDDIIVNNGDTIDLFFESLGAHMLAVSSTDFVGNVSTASINFRIVTTVSSTIADGERIYDLGWITREKVKDKLIRDLEKIVKLKTKLEWLEEKLADKPKVVERMERLEKVIDKILTKQILRELDRYLERGWLNEAGYNLLTEDINWLLNN